MLAIIDLDPVVKKSLSEEVTKTERMRRRKKFCKEKCLLSRGNSVWKCQVNKHPEMYRKPKIDNLAGQLCRLLVLGTHWQPNIKYTKCPGNSMSHSVFLYFCS